MELAEHVGKRLVEGEAADRFLALADVAHNLVELSVDYAAKQAAEFAVRIDSVVGRGAASSKRKTGVIHAVVMEKGFGFVRAGGTKYLFHVSDFVTAAMGILCSRAHYASSSPPKR